MLLQTTRQAQLQTDDQCGEYKVKGVRCERKVWSKCLPKDLCFRHDPTHPTYQVPVGPPRRSEEHWGKYYKGKNQKHERRSKLYPVPEDAEEYYNLSKMAQSTPIPTTSDSESETVAIPASVM